MERKCLKKPKLDGGPGGITGRGDLLGVSHSVIIFGLVGDRLWQDVQYASVAGPGTEHSPVSRRNDSWRDDKTEMGVSPIFHLWRGLRE